VIFIVINDLFGVILCNINLFPTRQQSSAGHMSCQIKKFRRAAVLTDKNWLKKMSEFEGAFFPGLEIKAFSRDQKIEAEAWLSSPDDNC
jgi:hypothetical protein